MGIIEGKVEAGYGEIGGWGIFGKSANITINPSTGEVSIFGQVDIFGGGSRFSYSDTSGVSIGIGLSNIDGVAVGITEFAGIQFNFPGWSPSDWSVELVGTVTFVGAGGHSLTTTYNINPGELWKAVASLPPMDYSKNGGVNPNGSQQVPPSSGEQQQSLPYHGTATDQSYGANAGPYQQWYGGVNPDGSQQVPSSLGEQQQSVPSYSTTIIPIMVPGQRNSAVQSWGHSRTTVGLTILRNNHKLELWQQQRH